MKDIVLVAVTLNLSVLVKEACFFKSKCLHNIVAFPLDAAQNHIILNNWPLKVHLGNKDTKYTVAHDWE